MTEETKGAAMEAADQPVRGNPADQPMWIREDTLMRACAQLLGQTQSSLIQATLKNDRGAIAYATGAQEALQAFVQGMQEGRRSWIENGCYSPFEHGVNFALDAAEAVHGFASFLADLVRITQPAPAWQPPEWRCEILIKPAAGPYRLRPDAGDPGTREETPHAAPGDLQGTSCVHAGCDGIATGPNAFCAVCEDREGRSREKSMRIDIDMEIL